MLQTFLSNGSREIRLWGEVTDSESATLRSVLVDALRRERLDAVTVRIADDAIVDDTLVGSLAAAVEVAADGNRRLRVRCTDPGVVRQLTAVGLTLDS